MNQSCIAIAIAVVALTSATSCDSFPEWQRENEIASDSAVDVEQPRNANFTLRCKMVDSSFDTLVYTGHPSAIFDVGSDAGAYFVYAKDTQEGNWKRVKAGVISVDIIEVDDPNRDRTQTDNR